jgi:hypothetical protein
MFCLKPKRPLEEVVGFLTARAVRQLEQNQKLEWLGIKQKEKQYTNDAFGISSTSEGVIVVGDSSPDGEEEIDNSIPEGTTKDKINKDQTSDDMFNTPGTIVLAQNDDDVLANPSAMVQGDLPKMLETEVAFDVESDHYIVDCEIKLSSAKEMPCTAEYRNSDTTSGSSGNEAKAEMKNTSADMKLPKGYKPLVLRLQKLDLTNLITDTQRKNIKCKKGNRIRLSDGEDMPSPNLNDRNQTNSGREEVQEESLSQVEDQGSRDTKKKKRHRSQPVKSAKRITNGECSPSDSLGKGSKVISRKHMQASAKSSLESALQGKLPASSVGSLSYLVEVQENEVACKPEEQRKSLKVILTKRDEKTWANKEKLASSRRVSKHHENKWVKTEKEGKLTEVKPEGRYSTQTENVETEMRDSDKKSEKKCDGQTDSSDNEVEIITQYFPVPSRQSIEVPSIEKKAGMKSPNKEKKSLTKKIEIKGERSDKPDNRKESKDQGSIPEESRKSVFSSLGPKARGKMRKKSVEVLDSSNSEEMSEEGNSSSYESSWNSDSDIKKRLFGKKKEQKNLITSRTRSKNTEDRLESLEISDKELLKKGQRHKHKRKLTKASQPGRWASRQKTVVVISSESDEESCIVSKRKPENPDVSPDGSEESSKKLTTTTTTKKKSLAHLRSSESEDGTSSSDANGSDNEESDTEKEDSPNDFNTKPRLTGRSKRKLFISSDSESDMSSEDSSVAVTSESDAPQPNKNPRKKRKKAMSSTEDTDEESEDVSPSKRTGRRNLRKIIDDEKLSMETKAAQKEEQKRLQRLKELASSRAQWTSSKGGEKETRIVLETKKDDSSKVIMEVSPYLAPHLKEHQVEGVRFMWDCVFETVEQACKKDGGSGCILAHCMGLGKTFQVVLFYLSFVVLLLVSSILGNKRLVCL